MNDFFVAYRWVVDHLGKVISGIGTGLVTIDIAGVAEPLKNFAREAFGAQGVKWVALGLFVALFARTAYTGFKHKDGSPPKE